jgi:uroporphyrinogen-III synthase
VHSAGGDGRALAELARRICDPGGLPLLLAGQQGQGQPLAQALREAGFTVEHRSVYAARPVAVLPEPARAALCGQTVEAALFFSAATAQVFVSLAIALPPAAFRCVESLAISPEAAAALVALPWQRIRVAAAPNEDQLLGLLS